MAAPDLTTTLRRFADAERDDSSGLDRAGAQYADLALRTFRLAYSTGSGPVTYGGQPGLPQGMSWPHREVLHDAQRWERLPNMSDGHPLSFLASYDLDAIAAEYGQPEHARLHGRLLVFVDARDRALASGFNGQDFPLADHPVAGQRDDYQVIHVPAGTPTQPVCAPEGATVWPASSLSAAPTWTYPGYGTAELDGRLSDDDSDHLSNINYRALDEDLPRGHPRDHQLLGWATSPAQHDPRYACPSRKDAWYDRQAMSRAEGEIYVRHPGDAARISAEVSALYQANYGWEHGSRDPWATDDETAWALLASIGAWDHQGGEPNPLGRPWRRPDAVDVG